MQSFVKMTKLTSVSGRAGYITSPDKQEEIVIMSETVDWTPYVQFEQQTRVKTNEGRELMIAIPNQWYTLPKPELTRRVEEIVFKAVGKSTDLQWAVHWNKSRTNLHIHAIFSERQKENVVKRWDRDIYLTNDGKIARKKADRATFADGTVKPPIHKKGDLKGGFTAKDTKYKTRAWLHETKQQLQTFMQERYNVKFDKQRILHQYHEGKGSDAPIIRGKNSLIKANNFLLDIYAKKYNIPEADLRKFGIQAVKKGKCLLVKPDGEKETTFRVSFIPQSEVVQIVRDLRDSETQSKTSESQSQAIEPQKEAVKEKLEGELPATQISEQRADSISAVPEEPTKENPVQSAVESKAEKEIVLPKTNSEQQIDRIEALMREYRKEEKIVVALRVKIAELGFFQRQEKKALEEEKSPHLEKMWAIEQKLKKEGVAVYNVEEKIESLKAKVPAEREALKRKIEFDSNTRSMEEWERIIAEEKSKMQEQRDEKPRDKNKERNKKKKEDWGE